MPAQPALSNRALLLAKVESSVNVDALPVATLDAMLVSDMDVRVDPNVLERNFYRTSLSPLDIGIGRKLATVSFRTELKASGVVGAAPMVGRLLRGAGFSQTQVAAGAASQIATPVAVPTNTGPAVTWAKTTAPTQNYGRYHVRVILGGASATARLRVTGFPYEQADTSILPSEEFGAYVMSIGTTSVITVSETNPIIPTYTVTGTPTVGDVIVLIIGGVYVKYTVASGDTTNALLATSLAAAATAAAAGRWTAAAATNVVSITTTAGNTGAITSGTTGVTLGAGGAVITPTWSGALVLNDSWTIDTLVPGFHYLPISTGFETLTMYCFYDGNLHRVTGAMGNVQLTAEAGNFGSLQFSFTGQYFDPMDRPLPTNSVFEISTPSQVEFAQLMLGNIRALRAQSFTVDMGIQINPRESVSHADGYDGIQYTARRPSGGLNPEMTYESEYPFWRKFALASRLPFHGRVGTVAGNRFHVYSPGAQLSSQNYADRNNNRVYDMSIRFGADSPAGDDEIRFIAD